MENLLQNQTPISPLNTIDARQDFSSSKIKKIVAMLLLLFVAGFLFYFYKSKQGNTALTDKERAELISKLEKLSKPSLSPIQQTELVNRLETQSKNSGALTPNTKEELINKLINNN